MPIHALHHVNLRASAAEVQALKDFYCKVVGLQEGERPRFHSPGYWLYADDAPIIHLSVAEADADVPLSDPRHRSVVNHIAFRCTDFKGILTRLRAHRVVFSVVEVPIVGELQVQFQDPSGIGVELTFAASAATD